METLELSENTVNPGQRKVGTYDFELLKVLGKGGYGKVIQCSPFITHTIIAQIWINCKSVNFRKNFIFANSVLRHICEIKILRLGHDLPRSVNDRVITSFSECFIFTKLCENKTIAKISKVMVTQSCAEISLEFWKQSLTPRVLAMSPRALFVKQWESHHTNEYMFSLLQKIEVLAPKMGAQNCKSAVTESSACDSQNFYRGILQRKYRKMII